MFSLNMFCRDILHKPVVIGKSVFVQSTRMLLNCSILCRTHLSITVAACGHMSCFWCVHNAMHVLHESHCPVCRQPYKHFPSICQLLHHLLLKLEPAEYKRREKEGLGECSKHKDKPLSVSYFLDGNCVHCVLCTTMSSTHIHFDDVSYVVIMVESKLLYLVF
jgi:hypothetical protein